MTVDLAFRHWLERSVLSDIVQLKVFSKYSFSNTKLLPVLTTSGSNVYSLVVRTQMLLYLLYSSCIF